MQPGPTRPAPGHPAEEGAGRIVTAVKIAFVDDEPELLAALHRAVRQSALRQGWDLAFHSDPREALQALSRQPAAVVVMDLKMPGMGGLQLATSLRARAPGTVFIVLSGCNEFQTAIETINRAGVFRYFLKPAAPAELIAGIADAVRHWRAANAEGSDIPAEPDGGPARAPLPAAAEGATGSAPLPGGGAPSKEAGMLALDMLAFGIGIFLAALGGAFTSPLISVQPGVSVSVIVVSFAVVIIGGLGSIPGAAIGAVIVGLARSFAVYELPEAEIFIIYMVMVLVLVFRPEGLFQRVQARKI